MSADNIMLTAMTKIVSLLVFGTYDNNILSADAFRVIISEDAGGLPDGPVLYDSDVNGGLTSLRTKVGDANVPINANPDDNLDEYKFSLVLNTPPTLPGSATAPYWIQVINNPTSSWSWRRGNPDTVGNGLPSFAVFLSGIGWSLDPDDSEQLALTVVGIDDGPRDCGENIVEYLLGWLFFGCAPPRWWQNLQNLWQE